MSSTNVVHPLMVNPYEVEMEEMTFRLAPNEPPMTFTGKILWRSEDGKHIVGVERITPEQAEGAPDNPGLAFSQFDHFLEGRVTIETEGQPPREVGKGDIVISPAGVKSVWTVHETMVKAFMMFSDEPIQESLYFATD